MVIFGYMLQTKPRFSVRNIVLRYLSSVQKAAPKSTIEKCICFMLPTYDLLLE